MHGMTKGAAGATTRPGVLRERYERLTPRERQLLALMAAGLTNAAIGEALWLSPKTVETHVRNILGKLVDDGDPGCHRRVAAVLVHLEAASVRSAGARERARGPRAASERGPVRRRYA